MKFSKGDRVRVGKFSPQNGEDGYGDLEWPEGQVGVIDHVVVGHAVPYVLAFEDADLSRTPNCFAEAELEALS